MRAVPGVRLGVRNVGSCLGVVVVQVALATLDSASLLTHVIGMHDFSLILHLGACLLRLILHTRFGIATRMAGMWISRMSRRICRITVHACLNVGAAILQAGRSARDHLRGDR